MIYPADQFNFQEACIREKALLTYQAICGVSTPMMVHKMIVYVDIYQAKRFTEAELK